MNDDPIINISKRLFSLRNEVNSLRVSKREQKVNIPNILKK